MNHTETAVLCRYVKAACPQQHFDEYTPDAWHDIIGDLRLDDCKQAVASIANQLDFIAPADIRRGVKAIREERLRATPLPDPPPGLGDDEVGYRRWLIEQTRRIADGEQTEPARVVVNPQRVIGPAFREVPPA